MLSLIDTNTQSGFHASFLGQTIGLNTNILEINLINLVIVISVVIYFGGEFLDSLLTTRKNSILQSLQEIENRSKQTKEQFEQAKNEWEKAQQTVKTINEQAEVTIQQVQSQLNDQFSQDIKKLEQTKQLTIQFEKQKILLQIRQQISQLAFKQANQKIQLKLVNPDVQRKLIDQKINLLNTIE